ncbi:hypothetical protein Tco_1477386, partial [Tanacetum coccineum]
MAEESGSVNANVGVKFDMPNHECKITAKDVTNLVRKYNIPLDLHPCAPTEGWMMNQLLDDHIGLYEQFFKFSGLRVPFSTFFLGVTRHPSTYLSTGAFSVESLEWKDRFLFIDRRAIPNPVVWRHHDYDVYDAFPDNDFSLQDVRSLSERIIDLRPVLADYSLPVGLLPPGTFSAFSLFSKIPEGM